MAQHNVLEYLEKNAARTPDAIAVTCEDASLTYAGLLDAARTAGRALVSLGVQGRPVVVLMEKGVDTLAAMLGVLYAGGFYAPVDPAAPASRLTSMYETLKDPLVIVGPETRTFAEETLPQARIVDAAGLLAGPETRAFAETLPGACIADTADPLASGTQGETATPDPLEVVRGQSLDTDPLDAVRRQSLDTDPVYLIFTSGTTGTPKGIAVSHRAVIDFIDTFVQTFGFTCDDVFANQAPFDFDVSVKDIYGSLAAGATLAIVPRRLFSQPAALVQYVRESRATVMIWAVAALCLVSSLHGLDGTDLPNVRQVLFSGEVMPLPHLATWMERLPQARFVNLYGPTEITCNCTYHLVDRDRDYSGDGLPLGEPFANRQVVLLGEGDVPVTEPDVPGEICVAGSSLALGYYNAPEQTARAFVRDPLQTAYPRTIYRTGDLGRLTEQGELFFCGRKDNQIKHLGHRVELEEIEVAFERQDGVTRCRCAYDPQKSRIHAFYEGSAESSELMARAGAALPAFMLPNTLERVDEMPLTKNGKVDRRTMLADYLARKERERAERKARRAARATAATAPEPTDSPR